MLTPTEQERQELRAAFRRLNNALREALWLDKIERLCKNNPKIVDLFLILSCVFIVGLGTVVVMGIIRMMMK